MSGDVKIFRRLACQVQSGSSYEDNAMFLMPFSSETANQTTDPIEDDSITGEGFKDIPMPGTIHSGGPIEQNLDIVSAAPILEAAMGSVTGGVFTFSNHSKKLSVCSLNSISANKYANAYLKNFKISSSVNNLVKLGYEFFGTTKVDRAATSAFPATPTAPYDPFTFHEMGGTYGYFRVGDAADALSASDDQSIEDFSIEVSGGFDEQYDNDNERLSLIPVYGMIPFSISGSFKLSRFSSTQFLTWSDELTPLQISLRIAKSASKYIQIDIPRLIVSAELSEDDLTRVTCNMTIARNGTGTTYKNTNMSFTSPLRITIANS